MPTARKVNAEIPPEATQPVRVVCWTRVGWKHNSDRRLSKTTFAPTRKIAWGSQIDVGWIREATSITAQNCHRGPSSAVNYITRHWARCHPAFRHLTFARLTPTWHLPAAEKIVKHHTKCRNLSCFGSTGALALAERKPSASAPTASATEHLRTSLVQPLRCSTTSGALLLLAHLSKGPFVGWKIFSMGFVDHPPQREQGGVLLACPPIIECGFDSSLPQMILYTEMCKICLGRSNGEPRAKQDKHLYK